jgi:hypothetical protein
MNIMQQLAGKALSADLARGESTAVNTLLKNKTGAEPEEMFFREQQAKLNEPERNDGILRARLDGRLAFEKTDIRFRTVATLKIEQVWMNVYHGGTKPSPYDQHLFIDNVVIARKYIGPRP